MTLALLTLGPSQPLRCDCPCIEQHLWPHWVPVASPSANRDHPKGPWTLPYDPLVAKAPQGRTAGVEAWVSIGDRVAGCALPQNAEH